MQTLARRLYQGVLTGYFADGEPWAKVERRAAMVTGLLPLGAEAREVAGLAVLDKAAGHSLATGLPSDSERPRLNEFTTALRLPVGNLPAGFAGENIMRLRQAAALRRVSQGQRPAPCPLSVPVLLASGEYAIWEHTGVTMFQEKVTREWVGRNSGFIFRVMKGVYYRTGGSKGHPVEHSSMEKQGVGSLVLTNRNVIFYSTTRSSKTPYRKIVAVIPYSDGIELQRDGTGAKRLTFQGFDSWFMINLLSYINV